MIATSEPARELLADKLKQPPSLSGAALPRQPQGTPQPPLPHYDPPTPSTSTSYERPRKRIISPKSLARFQSSQAFSDIMGIVVALNEAVKGRTLTDSHVDESQTTNDILAVLDTVESLVDETPPVENAASRFGNPAFRDFAKKVKDQSAALHARISGLPSNAHDEISIYFEESWGNEERIDYGSGMELNFFCWLLCLVRLNVLSLSDDGPAIVLRIFWRYIGVMRRIQSTYWLEPAGSHGVWGLDDYHFLPFVWGAAQLVPHRHLRPKSIHDDEILDEFAKDYMYLSCIRFINSIKTASLRWHSPMLDDISSVKTWSKVNEGMLKMYKAEVLSKLPIAQHIFFGSLIAFPPAKEGEEEDQERAAVDAHGHIHGEGEGQAAGWGDCCGIPIPSAFAAAQEKEAGGLSGPGIKRVPFD